MVLSMHRSCSRDIYPNMIMLWSIIMGCVPLLFAPCAEGACSFSTCTTVPSCQNFAGGDTLPSNRPFGSDFPLGAYVGTGSGAMPSAAYGDLRSGLLATMRIGQSPITRAGSSCSSPSQVVNAPYDEDVSTLLSSKGACFWINAQISSSNAISFTGLTTSGFTEYACGPGSGSVGPAVMGRPIASCKNYYSGTFGSSQKAQTICVTPPTSQTISIVGWKNRDGNIEDFYYPYLLSQPLAVSICASMGGTLGTPPNTSYAQFYTNIYSKNFWVGLSCTSTITSSCSWVDGDTSTVPLQSTGTYKVGASTGSFYGQSNDVIYSDPSQSWYHFLCSRVIQTVGVTFSNPKCYKTQPCPLVVSTSITIAWYHLPLDNTPVQFSLSFAGGSAVTVGFTTGQISATGATITGPSTIGSRPLTVSLVGGKGFNFRNLQTVSLPISDFEVVTMVAPSTMTYFGNQSFTFSASRPTSHTLTLTGSTLMGVPVTITAASTSVTISYTSPISSASTNVGITYSISGQSFYYSTTSPASLTFTILQQSYLSLSASATINTLLVAGSTFTITGQVSSSISTIGPAFSVTQTISSSAPVSLTSGSLFNWAQGAGGSQTMVYTCSNPGASAVLVTMTFSYAHVQFVALTSPFSFVFTVSPLITPTISASGTTFPTSNTATVVVTMSRVYPSPPTLSLTCAGATITPSSYALSASTSQQTYSFTVGSSVQLSCTLGTALTGSTSSYYTASSTTPSLQFTDTPTLSAALNVSTLYALRGGMLTIAASPAYRLGTDTTVINITWSGSFVSFVSTPAAVLTQAAPSATVNFTTTGNETGQFSFFISVVASQFASSSISNISLTISPLDRISQVNTLQTVQSTGYGYAQVLQFTLPALPEAGATSNGTLSFDATSFLMLPSATFGWASSDGTLSVRSVTMIGLKAVSNSAVSLQISGSSVKLNRTTLQIGSFTLYTRININTSVSSTVTYGQLPVTLNVSVSSTPLNYPLVLLINTPTDFGATASTISIPVGATFVTMTLTPTSQSSAVGTVSVVIDSSTNTTEAARFEGGIVSQGVVVYPLRSVWLTCNASRLYFGTGNALQCTLSVAVITAGLYATPPSSPYFSFSVTQLVFGSSVNMSFVVTPILTAPLSGVSSASFSFSLSDATYASNSISIVLKNAIAVSVSLPQYVYVGTTSSPRVNQFLVSFTATSPPDIAGVSGTVALVTAGLSYNVSSVVFALNSPSTQSVLCWGTVAGTYTFQYTITGSTAFNAQTDLVTKVVKPFVVVLSYTVLPSYVYVGQSATISCSMSDVIPGGTVVATPQYICNGVGATSSISTTAFTFSETTTTGVASVATTAACATGGQLTLSLSSTTTIVDTTVIPTISFPILPLKTVSATAQPVMYCGGLNTSSLSAQVSNSPDASFLCVQFSLGTSQLVTVSNLNLNFTQGSSIRTLFATITATSCPATATVVTLTPTLQSSTANTEFDSTALVPITVEVRPLLVVSLPSSLSVSSLYVGNTVSFTMSLPSPPDGTLVASITTNASLSVGISPSSFTFTASSEQSITVVVTAGSPTWIAIIVQFTGTASQYMPHPSTQYVLQFLPLGVISVTSSPPTSLFSGLASAAVVMTATMLPPAPLNAVVTVTSSNASAAYASPSQLVWNQSTSTMALVFNVVPAQYTAIPVVFSLSLNAPASMYTQTLNVNNFTLTIVSGRAVLWSVPSVIYVGSANAVSSRITISVLPIAGVTLSLSPSVSGSQASAIGINSIDSFSSSTSTSQVVGMQGFAPLDNVVLSLIITSGSAFYDVPPPNVVTVRALETFTISGLPSSMYVGMSQTFNISVSRLPSYCSSGTVIVSPTSNQLSSAYFSVPSVGYSATDASLIRQVTVTAFAATLASSPVQFTFPLSGTCTSIYAVPPTVTMSVFNLESVTISLPATNLDPTSYFVYYGNTLPLSISLGTPSIYHATTVVLVLQFSIAGAVGFSNVTVLLPPGVNQTVVQATGLIVTGSPGTVSLTVTDGATVFASSNTLSLRVLPTIPLSVTFPQTPLAFFVAGVPMTVSVTLSSTAIFGDVTVTCSYGSPVAFTSVTFAAQSALLTSTITVNASATVAIGRTLNLTLSGLGAGSYAPSVSQWPNVMVVPIRSVNYTAASVMFVTAANAQTVTFSLGSAPDNAVDVITVKLTNSQRVSWGRSILTLNASFPSATVSLTGLIAGTLDVSPLIVVQSVSTQYAASVVGSTSLTILTLRSLSVSSFTPAMYEGENQTCIITIPFAPLSGTLTVTPTLTGAAGATFSPAVLTFNSSTGLSLPLTIVVTGVFTGTIVFTTLNSNEYLPTAATVSLQSNSANQTTLFAFVTRIYVGLDNAFTFGISIRVPPPSNGVLTISMVGNTAAYSMTPSVLVFNQSSDLAQYVTVVGRQPVQNSQLQFSMSDTSSYFAPLAFQLLTVLPLETFSGGISTNLVYVGLTATITLSMTRSPGPAGLTINVIMQQPRQDNQNAYTLMTADQFTLSPAATIVLSGSSSTSFVLKALMPSLTPHVSFTIIKNSESILYDLTSLPTFDLRFVALRTVTLNAPTTLYIGLVSQAYVTLSATPDTGTFLTVSAASTTDTVSVGTTSQLFNPGDLTYPFLATPSVSGIYSIIFSVTPSANNIAYVSQTTPSGWTFNVRSPSVISLIGLPSSTFVGSANAFFLNISGYGTMSAGETLYVNLTCNTSAVVIFPSTIEVASMTPAFSVYSTALTSAVCNITFAASINRFVLDPIFLGGGSGLPISFLPLKTSFLSAPSVSSPYVNQQVSLSVTISKFPGAGRTLIATLGYAGSAANVQLSPPISWTSQSTALTQNVFIMGLSPATAANVYVTLSGDSQYASLGTTYPISFNAYFLITVNPPLQGYVSQSASIDFTLDVVKVVTVGIVFDIPTAMKVVDSSGNAVTPSVSWLFQDSQKKTAYLLCLAAGDVTVSFSVSGQDYAAFAVPQSVVVSCLSPSTVLVNAPAVNMLMYLSPAFYYTIAVGVLFRPAYGTLIVTPTLTCSTSPVPIVTISQSVFYFNASYALTQSLNMFGAVAGGPCDLSFPMSGNTTGYIGNRRFTVTVRPLINISTSAVPSEIYVGQTNQLPINLFLDPTTSIPLSYPVNISILTSAAGALCITVSPTTLYWAALSNTETLSKTITVTATCSSEALQVIGFRVTAATNIYQNNVPLQVTLNARPLISVTVSSNPPGEKNFILYVGGAQMSLSVALGGNLSSSETLQVSAVYSGVTGSMISSPALWLPSPVFLSTKQLVLRPLSVSPIAAINFVVVGPPRFNPTATGSGTLQIIGPVPVYATVPNPMIVGNDYSVTVTLGGSTRVGEQLNITVEWFGAPTALKWLPSFVIFDDNTTGLQQAMTFRAMAFQAGYRLVVRVSGSVRFTTVAFDGTITIKDAIQIISVSLPPQLMLGQKYVLGVDVRVLPPPGTTVSVITTTISGAQCISFPNGSTFSFNALNPTAPTIATVPVNVIKIGCPMNQLPFQVVATSDLSYSRTIASRNFSTVSPGVISLDWPQFAYVGNGGMNAVSGLILLVAQLADVSSYLSVLITASPSIAFLSTSNITYLYGAATSADLTLSHNLTGIVTFSFSIVTSDSFPTAVVKIPDATTTFLPLIDVLVDSAPISQMYTGENNMQRLALRLNTPLQSLDNGQPRVIRVAVVSGSTNLTVQPSYMQWSAGYSVVQFVYLVGVAAQLQVPLTFVLSGTGTSFVKSVPPVRKLDLLSPLLIRFSLPPTVLFVGSVNAVKLNVTLPVFDPSLVDTIQVKLSVAGDAASMSISPSLFTWFGTARGRAANLSIAGFFYVSGVYATVVANMITCTVTTGPTWIDVMPLPLSFPGTKVYDLQSLEMTPSKTTYSLYTDHTIVVSYTPATLLVLCSSTNSFIVSVAVTSGNITLHTEKQGFARILCTVNDTSYVSPPAIAVTSLPRKSIVISPSVLNTYVGIANSFTVVVDPLPSSILVISPSSNFSTDRFSLSPPALTYGPSSNKNLAWSVTGAAVSQTGSGGLSYVVIPILVVGPLDEFQISATTMSVQVQIRPFVSISITTQYPLTGTNPSAPFLYYRTPASVVVATPTQPTNLMEIKFQISQDIVFNVIQLAPDLSYDPTGSLRFCLSVTACITSDYSASKPITLSLKNMSVSVYVYSVDVVLRELVFNVINAANCIDYVDSPNLYIGAVYFRELEQVVVDASLMRPILYVGDNNSQTFKILLSNAPIDGKVAEITINVPSMISVNFLTVATGLTVNNRGNGEYLVSWAGVAIPVYIQVTGRFRSAARVQILLNFRSQPNNFWKTFNYGSINATVVDLIAFSLAVQLGSGTIYPNSAGSANATVFMGSDNSFTPVISTPTFPVLDSSTLDIGIVVSQPELLSVSASTVSLGAHANSAASSVPISVYAINRPSTSVATQVSVLFYVMDTTPSEFNRTSYTLTLTILPLQVLKHTLPTNVIAVGPDNAIQFTLAPKIPVSLTLNALVTCGDVSFTPVDTISWSNAMDPKRLKVSATLVTGLNLARCTIMTLAVGGGDKNTFSQPPFNATIFSLPRPAVKLFAQSVVPLGTSVASGGYNVTLTMTSTYFKWVSGVSVNSLLSSGNVTITSTRSDTDEPASFTALINRQLAQPQLAPFVQLFLDPSTNTMTFQFGPSPDFQPTTLETVTVTVSRGTILQQVSPDPTQNSVSFQVKGVKPQLLGNTGGFIGSGTSAASIIGALVSMTAAQQANRLQTISNAFVCPNQDWRQGQDTFQWNDEPIPLRFGNNDDLGGFAAVGVADLIVILGFMVLHLGVAYAVYRQRLHGSYADKSFHAALARVRFPSFLLVPTMFFYQTMVSSAFTTIMYSPVLWLRMVGAFTLVVFGFGVPISAYTIIGPGFRAEYLTEEEEHRRRAKKRYETNLRSVMVGGQTSVDLELFRERDEEAARNNTKKDEVASKETTQKAVNRAEEDDGDDDNQDAKATTTNALPKTEGDVPQEFDDLDEAAIHADRKIKKSSFGKFMTLFKRTGIWQLEDDPLWINRFEMFFGEYRGTRHWYLAIDISLTFLLGICDGVQPITVTQCLARTSVYVFLFCIQFLFMVTLRPYNSTFGNGFFILAYFLQFFSMVFVAVAVFRNDPSWPGVTAAVNALVIFGTALYGKTFLDFLQSINEKFELEKFFEAREDLNVKVLQGKKAEEIVVANFEREMTSKLVKKQEEKQRDQIGYMIRGPPVHDGRTLAQIEAEVLAAEARESGGYDPRRYLAKYQGPEGGEADEEEERVLQEHDKILAKRRVGVTLLEPRAVAPHYFDPKENRVKFTKRLDARFEKLLTQVQTGDNQSSAAASTTTSNSPGAIPRADSPPGKTNSSVGATQGRSRGGSTKQKLTTDIDDLL